MRPVVANIPRIIWILWYQGLAQAPIPVQICVDSWRRENPDWELVFLDKDNLEGYITLELPDEKPANLSLEKQANLVRLQLLQKY